MEKVQLPSRDAGIETYKTKIFDWKVFRWEPNNARVNQDLENREKEQKRREQHLLGFKRLTWDPLSLSICKESVMIIHAMTTSSFQKEHGDRAGEDLVRVCNAQVLFVCLICHQLIWEIVIAFYGVHIFGE